MGSLSLDSECDCYLKALSSLQITGENMCLVNKTCYNFTSSLLCSCYIIFSILIITVSFTVTAFEVNFEESYENTFLVLLPLIVSFILLIFGFCCLSSRWKCLHILFTLLVFSIIVAETVTTALLYYKVRFIEVNYFDVLNYHPSLMTSR